MLATRKFGKSWYVCAKRITAEDASLEVDESHIIDGPFEEQGLAYGAMLEAAVYQDFDERR